MNCDEPDRLFVLQTKTCISCPKYYALNGTTHKCAKLPSNVTLSSAEDRVLLGEEDTLKEVGEWDVPCRTSRPFFNGTDCIYCEDLYNHTSKQCTSCPKDHAFNKSTHSCYELPPDSTNPSAYNRTLLTAGASLPDPSQGIHCHEDKPFFNGKECIQCSGSDNLFDWHAQKCSSCDIQTSHYDSEQHKCVEFNNDKLTSKTAAGLINNGMPTQYWDFQHSNLKAENASRDDCPAETPYYDGTHCIECKGDTPYFNLETRKCQGCAEGEIYDSAQRDCVSNHQSTQTASTGTLEMSGSLFTHQMALQRQRHDLAQEAKTQ